MGLRASTPEEITNFALARYLGAGHTESGVTPSESSGSWAQDLVKLPETNMSTTPPLQRNHLNVYAEKNDPDSLLEL